MRGGCCRYETEIRPWVVLKLVDTEWVGRTSLAENKADNGLGSRLELGPVDRLAATLPRRFEAGLAERMDLDLGSLLSTTGGGERRVIFWTLALPAGVGS